MVVVIRDKKKNKKRKTMKTSHGINYTRKSNSKKSKNTFFILVNERMKESKNK